MFSKYNYVKGFKTKLRVKMVYFTKHRGAYVEGECKHWTHDPRTKTYQGPKDHQGHKDQGCVAL